MDTQGTPQAGEPVPGSNNSNGNNLNERKRPRMSPSSHDNAKHQKTQPAEESAGGATEETRASGMAPVVAASGTAAPIYNAPVSTASSHNDGNLINSVGYNSNNVARTAYTAPTTSAIQGNNNNNNTVQPTNNTTAAPAARAAPQSNLATRANAHATFLNQREAATLKEYLDAQKEKDRKKDASKRLRMEMYNEIRPLALGSIAMIASTLSNQAVPKLLGKLLDQMTYQAEGNIPENTCSASDMGPFGSMTCGGISYNSLAFIAMAGGAASFLRTAMIHRAKDSIAGRLRSQAFRSVMTEKDMEWFHSAGSKQKKTPSISSSPGSVGAILSEDVTKTAETATTTFVDLLRSICSCIFATMNMIMISKSLFLLSAAIVPVVGAAAVVLNKFVKNMSSQLRDLEASAAAFAEERIAHVTTVRISNRQWDEAYAYKKIQNKCVQLGRSVSLARGAFMGFMFAATSSAFFLVFHYGGSAVAEGRMTNGDITSFATFTFMLGLGTGGFFRAMSEIVQGLVSADRIYSLIWAGRREFYASSLSGLNQTGGNTSGTAVLDHRQADHISLQNVSFSYSSDTSKMVLNDISFSVKRGRVIALVGKNGAGKSTIASLVNAVYRPTSGMITVSTSGGDVDFNSLDRASQSRLVQLVPQHPAFFDASVWDNVTYCNKSATVQEVHHALRIANCNFVSSLDGGLNFVVGRNGVRLSGGQRQRLALARALLTDPCLLVLDEPTSALDAEGQSAVTDAVIACCGGGVRTRDMQRGLLLITHKAATLEIADDIIILENGKIIEYGQYDDLYSDEDSELRAIMPQLL